MDAAMAAEPRSPVSVIVHLHRVGPKPTPDASLDATRRARAYVDSLMASYATGGASLLRDLAAARSAGQVTELTPLWIANALALTAEPEIVRALAGRHDVRLVTLDADSPLEPWQPAATSEHPAGGGGQGAQWNLRVIRADDVWRMLGYDGRGVTVAVLDTGIDFHHSALMTQYRGYLPGGLAQNRGNWWCKAEDPLCGSGNHYPADSVGHGTHVAGTILGLEGVGVAPGAKWIAARVCPSDICRDSWIIEAMQWLLAPGGKPEERPQVMNGSFAKQTQNDLLFKDSVDAMVAGGIVTVVAAGNNPGFVAAPGSYPSTIAVGALTDEGTVWPRSGRGRSLLQEVKPEVIAPGVGITSTAAGGGWYRNTGTSMATPHVSGVAALLLQVNPDLTPLEIKEVLKRTATPLSANPPDPDSGWGVVNAFAAVASVTDVGYIAGHVLRQDGALIPWARIHLAEMNGDHLATVAVNPDDGSYEIAVRPGTYLVTAEAFTFELDARRGVAVQKDQYTALDFSLEPTEAMGTIHGWVYGWRGGNRVPLAAIIRLAEAPAGFEIRADEFTGFAQQLPSGTYHARIEAFGYRVATDVIKITAAGTTPRTYELNAAPRILLVDGDAWMYRGAIDYYRASLTRLGYLYDQWRVTDETAGAGASGGPPTAASLANYDLVIWSSSSTSPGFVGGASDLTAYVAGGGKLFLSGQDALCTDAGTDVADEPCNRNRGRHPYVQDLLRLRVLADSANSYQVFGTQGGPLAGLTLTLNGEASMDNQFAPDVVAVTDRLAAEVVGEYEGGRGAAVFTGTCLGYGTVAFGFGFEGINGVASRDEVMDRVITALTAPPPPQGLRIWPDALRAVTRAGRTADYTTTLRNVGSETAHFTVTVETARWDTSLWRAGFVEPLSGTIRLGKCEQAPFGIRVTAPAVVDRGESDTARIQIRAQGGGANGAVAVTTSIAAPVLVVDGDVWLNSEQRYLAALRAAGMRYDLWEFGLRNSAPKQPRIEDLAEYPAVVWFTGYDWRPNGSLSLDSQRTLAAYLEQGGRLLFSSEDYLLFRGGTPYQGDRLFHEVFLGVAGYHLDEGRAHLGTMSGAPDSIFEGVTSCLMPPRSAVDDVSDRLEPRSTARAAILDGLGQVVATQFGRGTFKTVFLAFDAGLLDQSCADALMSRSLDWFSALYPSSLADPTARRTYAAGERVTLELQLLNEGQHSLDGVQVRWQLPPGSDPEVIPPGWSLDAASRALTWQGDLGHERKTTVVSFLLDHDLPDDDTLTSIAEIADGQGFTLRRQVELRVNAPDLRDSEKTVADPQRALAVGDRASFFVIVRNTGTRPADRFIVTDTLPSGLRLIPGSVRGESGDVDVDADPAAGVIIWRGRVDAGHQASLSYDTRVATYAGGDLRNRALLADGHGDLLALSAAVFARPQLTLPWLGRQFDADP